MNRIDAQGFTLEPQTAAHAAEMFAILSDPALYQFENSPPSSVEWLQRRFQKLESRRSPDGTEEWLNWVIRVPSAQLIGFVQATVFADHRAAVAYVLGSNYWGRGFARAAVAAMLAELAAHYAVESFSAVLKERNLRSSHLLQQLGFTPATAEALARFDLEPGEILMQRAACR